MADETKGYIETSKYMTIKQDRLHDATQTEIKRDGERLTIGANRFHIIGRDINGDYVVERIEEGA